MTSGEPARHHLLTAASETRILALLGSLAALTAVASILGWLAPMLAPGSAVTETDVEIARYVLDQRTDGGLWAMRIITIAGDLWFVTVLVVAFGATAVVRTGQWRPLWLPAAAGAGALVISTTVKLATGRGRPEAPFATVEALGDAFPSGHALRAMAVYAALAWLVTAAGRRRGSQLAAWTAAGALILLVGASRIYLGAHWLTDVLAGYLFGAVWLLVVVRVTAVPDRPPDEAPPGPWPGPPVVMDGSPAEPSAAP